MPQTTALVQKNGMASQKNVPYISLLKYSLAGVLVYRTPFSDLIRISHRIKIQIPTGLGSLPSFREEREQRSLDHQVVMNHPCGVGSGYPIYPATPSWQW